LFQQRKNKHFNYTPRHLRDSKEDEDIKTHWESVRRQSKYKGKRSVSIVMLLVILGMIIAIWFILTHYEIS